MRVLIVEGHADGMLDLGVRAKAHGHAVRYFCADRTAASPRPIGKGLLDCVSDWRGSMRWADIVLLGGHYCMPEFDRWMAAGVPIIGAGSEVARWEDDRLAGMQEFRRAGIPIPPYRHCGTLDEAIAYVQKRDEGMAVKPSGNDVTDKSLSFVAKTAKEMVWRLARWKKEGRRFPDGLMLQDRVEGVEFAVGAWVGPGGFAPGWEENAEEKKLFAGGVGPACGESGTIMRLVKRSKLAQKVLAPFEDRLTRLGYCGNVDVNCIIDDDGTPWPLEWTCRFGYPAINIELALHDGDPIEFIAGVASGRPPNTRRLDEVAVGVVMALPPYPYGHEKAEEVVGVPIWGMTPGIENSIHLANAMERDGQLETAGSYVLVATGTGESVTEARRGAYRVLNRLTIPASPFYRVDIGQRLRSEIDKLNAHGFALGLKY